MSGAVPANTYAAPTTYGAYGSTYGASCALAVGIDRIASHRSPFLSDVDKGKDKDELGEKQRITPGPDLLCNVVYASPARRKITQCPA